MKPEELLDFLRKVQQELGTAWPQLHQQWLAQDWPAVQRGAHRLKSVVGSVGCEVLYEALHQLENRLRDQPAALPGSTELAQLKTAVAEADQALLAAVQAGHGAAGV